MRSIVILSLFLMSCSMEYRFQSNSHNDVPIATVQPEPPNNSQSNPEPIVDPDTEVPKVLKFAQGVCSPLGTEILSCLSCRTEVKNKEADLSEKAKALISIMTNACKIKNKSDPAKEMVGTAEKIFAYLSSGSQINYPDSTMTSSQKKLITELKSSSSSLYQRLFGGVWYQPPYSDDFETYFGVSVSEAKSLFCFDTPTVSFGLGSFLELHSKEYIDCVYSGSSFHCSEKQAYVQANGFRAQLQATMNLSLKNPFNPNEPEPVKECFWETVEGVYNQDFEDALITWVNKGYQIGIYFEEGAPRCEPFKQRQSELKGKMKAAAYICEDL